MVYPLVSPLANLCVLVGSYSCKKDRATTLKVGEILLGAYTDLNNLVGCDTSFLIGPWIADAKKWANATDAPEKYYEWMVSNFRHSPSVLSGSRQPAQEPLLPVASPRSRQNSD